VEREIHTAVTQGRAEDRRWHVRKDGTRLFIDGVLIRLDDDDGQLHGFVKIGRDATAQRHAEEALQRARDELELRVQARTAELDAANQTLRQEIRERSELEAQRAFLMESIITAQEGERQRIAHELHDSLGQFLSVLNLRLSMLESAEGILPTVSDEFTRLRALASQIDREVDRLTMELRPPALGDLGLADALYRYAEEWTATSGVEVDVLVTGLGDNRLASAIETATYRIVQEALTNVLKHAQASLVSVIVECKSSMLRVIVEDDGMGFDRSLAAGGGTGGRQVGLIGMAERATLAGGELTIETAPGAGTTIYLHIPLGEDRPTSTGAAHE
jgi:signal transduction histidine kinase